MITKITPEPYYKVYCDVCKTIVECKTEQEAIDWEAKYTGENCWKHPNQKRCITCKKQGQWFWQPDTNDYYQDLNYDDNYIPYPGGYLCEEHNEYKKENDTCKYWEELK